MRPWLTAYAARVIGSAIQEKIVAPNNSFIQHTLNVLMNQKDIKDSSDYYYKGPSYDDSPIQLKSKTAYMDGIILLAFLKNKPIFSDFESRYGTYVNSIIERINALSSVVDAYAHSVYAYALALEGSPENVEECKEILQQLNTKNSQTNGDKRLYFNEGKKLSSLSLQMSSYVALAYITLEKLNLHMMSEVEPIINWISSIKTFGEPWNNAIAIEALTEAAKFMSSTEANYTLTLTASDNEVVFNVNKNNWRNYQYQEISKKSGSLEVNAAGQGYLSVDVVCEQYNQKAKNSELVDLKVTTSGIKDDSDVIGNLLISIRCKQQDCSEMFMLEVQLQSGFMYDASLNDFLGHAYVKVRGL